MRDERPNIWLSIDWDFFSREEEEWDFGHDETQTFFDIAWTARASMFLAQGQDLREETALHHADPMPSRFFASLRRAGYRFDNVRRVVVADSHKWAYQVFDRRVNPGPHTSTCRIVHFDAHHDLIYGGLEAQKCLKADHPDCGNWHLLTLARYDHLRSLIVYPSWKGTQEWDLHRDILTGSAGFKMRRYIEAKTKVCVWPDPRVEKMAGDVEMIFICRSGAWVPPWHDGAFRKFVQSTERITGCEATTPFAKEEGIDVFAKRRIDWDSVYQAAAIESLVRRQPNPSVPARYLRQARKLMETV